jgi:amidase
MKPRISLIGLMVAASYLHGQSNAVAKQPFSVIEASIPQMQAAMQQGRLTSRQLVTQYLTRIAIYEDKLHAASP